MNVANCNYRRRGCSIRCSTGDQGKSHPLGLPDATARTRQLGSPSSKLVMLTTRRPRSSLLLSTRLPHKFASVPCQEIAKAAVR